MTHSQCDSNEQSAWRVAPCGARLQQSPAAGHLRRWCKVPTGRFFHVSTQAEVCLNAAVCHNKQGALLLLSQKEGAQMATAVKPLDSPEPTQRNSSVAPGEGDRRVVVPPARAPNARNDLLVMSALQARASVSALNSASPPRPKNAAGRCFRCCGSRGDGPNHGGAGAKSNSEVFAPLHRINATETG